ncbi:sensor histidine kinase [Anaerobacillus alkaliphilus]|nr:sensor histidine kinase [Anaerobacillus alkaliphilus]
MLPFQLETHWVFKTAQVTRIAWFIFHLLFFVIYLQDNPLFWLLMPLFFTAFLIPQWSGTKLDSFGVRNYPFLELIFSGLLLIIGCFVLGNYSSFLSIPALCAGLYSKPGKHRWYLWTGFSIVPILAVMTVGFERLGLGVIEGSFFFGIGIAVAKMLEAEQKAQQLLEENQRQNQLLEAYAKQIEKVTLLEERNRLARDLHDTIGHTFTSVIMGLDAVSYLVKTSPDKAQEHVDGLSNVMRRSLGEVRTYIHQISPYEGREDLSSQLQKIASEFTLLTKTKVDFKLPIKEVHITSLGTTTLIRCLQEALTNAVRHGRASEICIELGEEDSWVMLAIKDNGIGIKDTPFGFGLTGMRERLESLQGELNVKTNEFGGTSVTCFLPTNKGLIRGRMEQDDQSVNCG